MQSVINCLTDAMRSKELKPGDRIPPEPELAASMGVARSSVREAIKILSYLGVPESKRAEGTFATRYETVAAMLNTGRGEELIAAHRRLLETLQSRRLENVEELVRTTYFEEALPI